MKTVKKSILIERLRTTLIAHYDSIIEQFAQIYAKGI